MQIEDNITQEYRADVPRVPEPAAPAQKKPKPKPAPATGKKYKTVSDEDDMMEVIMKRCMVLIHREMAQLPEMIAKVTRPLFVCSYYFRTYNTCNMH
jgi:hypothetical protein